MDSNLDHCRLCLNHFLFDTKRYKVLFLQDEICGAIYPPFDRSVTRFNKILPLWENFVSLGQIYDGLFCIWQILILVWQNIMVLGFCVA